MKTILGSIVYFATLTPVSACPVRAICTIPLAVPAATLSKLERRVGLCLQAEGNQFQHPL
jgi:hypothetical protein